MNLRDVSRHQREHGQSNKACSHCQPNEQLIVHAVVLVFVLINFSNFSHAAAPLGSPSLERRELASGHLLLFGIFLVISQILSFFM